jgi:peptidylprolyl isomerase
VPARGPDRRRSGSLRVALVTLTLVVGIAACMGDDAQEGDGDATTQDALDLGAAPSANAILDPEREDPPVSLQIEDVVEGTGAAVATGDELMVEYLGWRWSDGGEFASSWGAGEPLRFELGAGRVIPGWEQGIRAEQHEAGPLRVGGRRVLTIPPELAYGDRGSGSAVAPGETLVFVIDLIALDDPDDPDDPDDDASSDDGVESELADE